MEHRRILKVIASIPRGRVVSYGEIAARAGQPRRARLVGRLLRMASVELKLPWHRVLCASGRLAFAPDSASFREQLRRLNAEGVEHHQGKIDLVCFGWQRNLDAQLWARR